MDLLSRDNPIMDICALMGVSRAGYYKWKNRGPSPRDTKREEIVALVKQVHAAHPTHGYRWTAAYIRINMQVIISDNYAYKCYRYLGVKAETRHRVRYSPRKVRDLYPNLIFSAWETVDRPGQVIVSDMTVIKVNHYCHFEVTLYFDAFTKEILSWKVADRRGARDPYIDGLEDVIALLKGQGTSAQLSAIKCSAIVVLCAKKCNFVDKTPARKCSNTYGKNCISETCRMER